MDQKLVTLRTGAVVPRSVYHTTTLAIGALVESDLAYTALFELRELAHNPDSPPQGDMGALFEGLGLTQGGRLHDVTREVVLASFVGDDADFSLVAAVDFRD